MLRSSSSWSTPQLTGFLAHLSALVDVAEAFDVAAVDVAEAVDAEVAAVVIDGTVVSSIGFPEGKAPQQAVLEVAMGRSDHLEIPGHGRSPAVAVRLDAASVCALVVARSGDEEFNREERNLLRGMGSALTLAMRLLNLVGVERGMRADSERQARAISELLGSVRERQRLLQAMSTIDRAIAHRSPVDEILDAITAGVLQFLRADVATLRLVDRDDQRFTDVASGRGLGYEVIRRLRVSDGTSGRAYLEDQLVAEEDCVGNPGSVTEFGACPGVALHTVMAAPVHEGGRVVGSLAVGSAVPGRTFTEDERAQLVAFAEQATIALTDVSTLAAMHQARRDPLTGLATRALFIERVNARLSGRSSWGAAVLFLDLDGLKMVNDTLGHPAGDDLLVQAARGLTRCVRAGDLVARLGGDEFVVLVEEAAGIDEARLIAERILEELRMTPESEDSDIRVTASIGVVLVSGATDTVEELLRRADLAMYRAKANGGDRWELYRPSFEGRTARRPADRRHSVRAASRGRRSPGTNQRQARSA